MPNDWRLVYPGTDLAFGSVTSGLVFPVAPAIGTTETEADDTRRPRGDGTVFGVDYLSGQTIGFAVDVVGPDESATRARLATLARAWRGDAVRSSPGAVAELVAHTGRSTFGRPRRFVSNDDEIHSGLAAVTADFVTADDLWYGPEQAAEVSLVPAAGGGLVAPLASPLSTTATSDRSAVFQVDGEVPTWPVLEVAGPLTSPVIEIVGVLRIELDLTLAYDQTLVIDTRPWARTVLRDGASVSGRRTRASTRLDAAALPPGTHQLVLRGASATGTARATARWRNAYTTP